MKKIDKAYAVARKFTEENDVIRFKGTFYLFNEGVWRLESSENTEAWISNTYIKMHSEPANKSQIQEISQMIQNLTYEKYRKQIKYLDDKKTKNTINIKSGILNLDTLEVKPYEKEDFCFHKLPFDYIDNPKCPTMAKFLTTSMNFPSDYKAAKDSEEYNDYLTLMYFIQEWMGYTLIPGNPYHKAMIMVGDGRNGKGVLQFIWGVILGKNNVSHVDIKGINDGKEMFMTRNKLVNFSHDIESGQQLDTGVMKSATAGETVSVNEKYKPQYEMEFTAKIVIACNDLPYIKNTGSAVKERFYVLPFDRVFTEAERDPKLKEKLLKEAEHIFSWAVKGLTRLQNRGYFLPPKRSIMSGEAYIRANDSVSMWLDEDNLRAEGEKTERQEAWKAYKWYCESSGLRPGGKIKFYEKMEKKGFDVATINGKRYFKDIKLPNSV